MKKSDYVSGMWRAICFLVLLISSAATKEDAIDPSLYVDEFEISHGKAVQTGFVFVDGTYLNMPYRVDRVGLGIFINDRLVKRLPRSTWPPYDLRVDELPLLPADIDEQSGLEDVKGERYLARRLRYIYQHRPKSEQVQEMVDIFKELPFVASAIVRDGKIVVEDLGGKKENIAIFPPPGTRIPPPQTHAQVLALAEAMRAEVERKLVNGYALIYMGGHCRQYSSERSIKNRLPYIVHCLQSNDSVATKKQKLRDYCMIDYAESSGWSQYLTNFMGTAELQQRVEALGVDIDAWERRQEEMVEQARQRKTHQKQ